MPVLVERGNADALALEAVYRAKRKAAPKASPLLGDTPEEAEARRLACRSDLGAYGEFVHGNVPARHHRLWIDLIAAMLEGRLSAKAAELGLLDPDRADTYRNKLLLLAPPSSAKSSWISIALPTWFLGNHPDSSVLFFTSSDPVAVSFGNTIKSILEHDEKHRAVFPDAPARPHKSRGWSTDGLYLRATPTSGQSPAYRAVGLGASVMGARAGLIVIDDPQNQEDAESATEQAKAKKYVDMTVIPRLRPGAGFAVAVMTRWAENDLASHFIAKASGSGDWLVVALPLEADVDDPLGRAPGALLWPEQYPEDWLRAEKQSMGTAQFACVYNASVAQMAGDVFSDERWFKPLPPDFRTPGEGGLSLRDRLLVVQGADVAFSEKDSACYTVVVTVGFDRRTWDGYLLDVRRDRMTIGATEDALVEGILLHHPSIVALEDTAFKHGVTRDLIARIQRRVPANVQPLHPKKMGLGGSHDKVARARLPAARAEAGQVYADKDAHWWPTFISEVLAFPRSANSDQVDAMSIAWHIPLAFQYVDRRPRRVAFNPN